MLDYSTKRISKTLLEELKKSLRSVVSYGSVEIIVQDNVVTQISVRSIKKTIDNGAGNGPIRSTRKSDTGKRN